MTTLTLRLQLDEKLVSAYHQAKPKDKAALKKLFERLISSQLRSNSVEEMIQQMEETGKEAQINGLTEDIIDEILTES